MIYRKAALADAAALSDFAERVFVSSYESQLPRGELETFARSRFTHARHEAEITSADDAIFLALNPEVAAYAHVAAGSRPACALSGAAPAELKRIYVDGAWHGRGVAPELMQLVEAEARQRGCDILWLGVWVGNDRAIAFYGKHGFAIIGRYDVAVGNLSLGHHYMAKPLRDLPQG